MYAKLIGAPPTDTDYNYKSYHLVSQLRASYPEHQYGYETIGHPL